MYIQLLIVFFFSPLWVSGQSPLQVESIHGFPGQRTSFFSSQKDSIRSFVGRPSHYKLNDTYIPSHYDLKLKIFLENDPSGEQFTAHGEVAIDFQVDPVEMSQVMLHFNRNLTNNLPELEESTLTIINVDDPSENIIATEFAYAEDDTHFLTISTNTSLRKGVNYKLSVSFIAPINTEDLSGLYLSSYVDSNGEVKRVAATQMEAYHSRQLYPCFDEPGLRATFDLTIIHKKNYTTVLGNTHRVSFTDLPDEWAESKFERTPPMPTYLLAIIVSDFDFSQAPDGLFDKTVRTYAPPPVIAREGGVYSAQIAAKLLSFFDTYFDTIYPLTKMDSVHVPDFSAGAMENWGLNIYREAYLIYYPEKSLESYKNLLTSVVSHELAHQNFGNRVTCKFWNELWLNEGFATYVSYLGVDAVAPEFRHREWILNDAFQYSMNVDVSVSSHNVINDAVSPDEVDEIFSGITYEKGGSINRMTENFLTEATYKKGLQYYLKDKNYQGVVSTDLFRNLDEANTEVGSVLPANLTVEKILNSWTTQKSHPLVRVNVDGPKSIIISQERYSDINEVSLWYVPITIATKSKPILANLIPQLWLEEDVPLKKVDVDSTQDWVMINQNATGYYRVLYDQHLTSLIAQQLNEDAQVILPLSRSQLLDDYFQLAFRGHVSIEDALSLTKYLEQEDHFTVWEVVFTHLRRTYGDISSNQDFSSFKSYILPKVAAALKGVGLEQSDDHYGALGILRSKLIDWACALGDNDCVGYAHQLHSAWNSTLIPVPKDIQASIFCTIVSTGGEDGFQFLLGKFISQTDSWDEALKSRLLNGLACAREDALIQQLLDLTLATSSHFTPAQSVTIMQRAAMTTRGRQLVLQFLQANLNEIIRTVFKESLAPLRQVAASLSNYLSTQEELDQFLSFYASYSTILVSEKVYFNAYLNTVRGNLVFRNTFEKRIISWMEENKAPPPKNAASLFIPSHFLIPIFVFISSLIF